MKKNNNYDKEHPFNAIKYYKRFNISVVTIIVIPIIIIILRIGDPFYIETNHSKYLLNWMWIFIGSRE